MTTGATREAEDITRVIIKVMAGVTRIITGTGIRTGIRIIRKAVQKQLDRSKILSKYCEVFKEL